MSSPSGDSDGVELPTAEDFSVASTRRAVRDLNLASSTTSETPVAPGNALKRAGHAEGDLTPALDSKRPKGPPPTAVWDEPDPEVEGPGVRSFIFDKMVEEAGKISLLRTALSSQDAAEVSSAMEEYNHIRQDMIEIARCTNCKHLLCRPRLLRCGHTFCYRCLRDDFSAATESSEAVAQKLLRGSESEQDTPTVGEMVVAGLPTRACLQPLCAQEVVNAPLKAFAMSKMTAALDEYARQEGIPGYHPVELELDGGDVDEDDDDASTDASDHEGSESSYNSHDDDDWGVAFTGARKPFHLPLDKIKTVEDMASTLERLGQYLRVPGIDLGRFAPALDEHDALHYLAIKPTSERVTRIISKIRWTESKPATEAEEGALRKALDVVCKGFIDNRRRDTLAQRQ